MGEIRKARRAERAAVADAVEVNVRGSAEASGLELAVSRSGTDRHPHWVFRHGGRKVLEYWPASKRCLFPDRRKTHAYDPWAALGLAQEQAGLPLTLPPRRGSEARVGGVTRRFVRRGAC